MKFFKATVSPKKSHPENPQDLVFLANNHKTQKDFADEIKAMLEQEDVNHNFWFAPKVERIEEDEFNAIQQEMNTDNGEYDENLSPEDVQSQINEINHTANAQDKIPGSELVSTDSYYWFQYTKNNPIVVKVQPVGEKFRISYKFESELFIEIDKQFERSENGVIFALGLVIDDCTASPSADHTQIIRGIGSRGESAIPDALMTHEDVVKMIGEVEESCGGFKDCGTCPSCKTAGNVKPWENNPDVKYPDLYATIVEVITHYKGEKIPSAADCYDYITRAAATYFGKYEIEIPEGFEAKISGVIADIKNPHNLNNGTSAAQILMKAYPEIPEKTFSDKNVHERLAEKFGDSESDHEKVERMVFGVSGNCKFFIEVSGEKFHKVKYNIHGADFEYRDTAELDNKYEAVIFALNRIKGHLLNHFDAGKVNAIINNAKSDPLVWFDSYVNIEIPCEQTRAKNTNACSVPSSEVVNNEPKQAETLPTEPESLPGDDLGFDLGDEPEKSEPEKSDKSDFEKMVEEYNEEIEALEPGQTIVFDDMPNEIYHAVVGVSSSKIKDGMISMQYYNAKHNTKEIEQETGSQFDIGNVFHSICLEPDLTSKEYIREPSGDNVPKKPTDPQIEKYNAWRKLGSPEKKENPKAYPTDLMFERCGFWNDFYDSTGGLYPVAAEDWQLAEAMVNSAMNDEDSSKILKHPARRCEISYFKRCEVTGLIIKARPDVEIGRIIGDLKSIAMRGKHDEKYLISALRKEVFNRGYHISAAMYLDITGKDQFLWIFTNKQKGYHWTATVRASSEILEQGREIYVEYKQKIADSCNSGKWAKPESIQSKRNAQTNKIELPEI